VCAEGNWVLPNFTGNIFFCGERVMHAAKSGHIQKASVEGRLKIEDSKLRIASHKLIFDLSPISAECHEGEIWF
jgi:hypothetical protein